MNVWLELSRYVMIANSVAIYAIIFESRLSKRATICSIAGILTFVMGVNIASLKLMGVQFMVAHLPLTSTLPSMLFFVMISRFRDMRFLFTICSANVLNLWIVALTSLFHITGTPWVYVIMFFSRVALSVALDGYIYFRLRKDYQLAQKVLESGWGVFAAISAGLYALLLVSSSYPALIFERPGEIYTFSLILVMVPLVLYSILYVIIRQLHHHFAQAQQQVMKIQIDAMRRQLDNQVENEENMRVFRHDMRHQMKQVQGLLKSGDVEEALNLIGRFGRRIDDMTPQNYCENLAVNAMLSYYLQWAASHGIEVSTQLNIPEAMEVDPVDLSTVLANALENACNANMNLPVRERWLKVSCFVKREKLMLEIANPYAGEVRFDERGIPLSADKEHGVGSISIMAFAKKYQAIWDYQVEENVFRLRMLVNLPEAAA